jgi:hypothetical protein
MRDEDLVGRFSYVFRGLGWSPDGSGGGTRG